MMREVQKRSVLLDIVANLSLTANPIYDKIL